MIQSNINETIDSQIDEELIKLDKQDLIIVLPALGQKKFSKELATSIYEAYHDGLSTKVIPAQQHIIFSEKFINIENYYHGFLEFENKKTNRFEEIMQDRIEAEKEMYTSHVYIYEFLSSKLNFIPSSLTKEIEKLKNSRTFPCCEDTNIIIQSLINHYIKVIKSPTEQIDFFSSHLQLNKKLSNLLSLGIVNILEQVLKIRKGSNENLKIENIPLKDSAYTNHKLIWQGKQKELVELIVELQKKNWIKEIPEGMNKKAAQSICNLFDLTGTKRNEFSDEQKSFEQSLKGEKIDGAKSYERVFGKRYINKFEQIKNNE